jgi:hypothetical protein
MNTAANLSQLGVYVNTSSIKEFLKIANHLAEPKLQTVSIWTESNTTYLRVTSRGNSVTMTIPGAGSAGSTMVPFKLLNTAVQGKNRRVFLSWTENSVSLGDEASITGIDCAPYRGMFAPPGLIKIPSQVLSEGLGAALTCADEISARNYGTVVLMETTENTCSFVGTDGFRLARSQHWAPGLAQLNGIRLPARICNVLYAAAKTKHEISIGVTEDKVSLVTQIGENIHALLRLSEVKYPDYKSVIPAAQSGKRFAVKELLDAFKVALCNTDKSHVVHFNTLSPGVLTVFSRAAETEEYSRQSVDIGGDFMMDGALAVNAKFVVDALSSTDCAEGLLCLPRTEDAPLKLILGAVEHVIVPILEAK